MKKVYLDNAATTQLRPEVVAEMTKVLLEDFGNPSSTHAFGRNSKNLIELSRKSIAKNLFCTAQEIIFTSCGTEANNFIIQSCIRDLKIERIITSKIEHHAVLHTIEILEKQYDFTVDFVKILPTGDIDVVHLTELLSSNKKTLVSLMHVNNEIGTVLNLDRISKICKQYNAYFHTDTVQSVGKTIINLKETPIDFLVASAHKFHGPKGIGFAFIRKGIVLNPILLGGEQEKGLRAGTESVHNIVGLSNALDISYLHLVEEQKYILGLKQYCFEKLKDAFQEIKINGESDITIYNSDFNFNTFYNILNVILPLSDEKTAMLLFHLDIKGIAVSRGSACQSGSNKPSHVLAEFLNENDLKKPSLRISFSHYNTKDDIDYLIDSLKSI